MRWRGHPAVRSSTAAGHPEVCPHGVPGAGQSVRQRVEADPSLDPPDDVPLEPGDWNKRRGQSGGESSADQRLTSSYGEISDFIVQVVTVHIEDNADVEDEEGHQQVGDVGGWKINNQDLRISGGDSQVTRHPSDGDVGPGPQVVRLPGGGRDGDGRDVDGGLDNIDGSYDVCDVGLGQHGNWNTNIKLSLTLCDHFLISMTKA